MVPEDEHFDASAVGEGVWLSIAHLNNIETAFSGHATNVSDAALAAQQAASDINSLTEQLAAANQTIADRDATITAQVAEIATLKAAPAKPAAATVTTEDTSEAPVVVESETTREARKLYEMRNNK